MTTPLVPILTDVGTAAAVSASSQGLQIEITDLVLGDGSWTPDATATALQSEVQHVGITAAEFIPPNQFHLTTLLDGPEEYWIHEFGLIADGILLAVWSEPGNPLTYKSNLVDIVFHWDIALVGIPPGSVTVANIQTDLHLTLVSEYIQMAADIVELNTKHVLDTERHLDHELRLIAIGA